MAEEAGRFPSEIGSFLFFFQSVFVRLSYWGGGLIRYYRRGDGGGERVCGYFFFFCNPSVFVGLVVDSFGIYLFIYLFTPYSGSLMM